MTSSQVRVDEDTILVSKLTKEIIEEAIQEFIDEDPGMYWLKLYHVTSILEIEDLNKILCEKKDLVQIDKSGMDEKD